MELLNEGVATQVALESEGWTLVRTDEGFNYVDSEGNFLSEENFIFADSFIGGKATVKRMNGLWNYIKTDGTMLCSEDFVAVAVFVGPVGYVYKEGKWFTIDKAGNLLV
jgi:hypothetical protein